MVPVNRFQIEELLHQDADGVVYWALDRETGANVALHRFFPFGAEDRGLAGSEIQAFVQGVLRLQELRHPGLSSVLGGACDAVDGMPYLILASRQGKTLADYLWHAALTLEQAHWLAEEILLLMQWLTQQIGHEVNWLFLQPHEIELVEDEQQGVSFRFAIDPMKWLDRRPSSGFFSEFAALLEQSLGWTGRTLTAGNAGPFSQWLKKIKMPGMTVDQAMKILTLGEQLTQHAPLLSDKSLSARPLAPKPIPMPSAQKNSHTGWYVIAALLVFGGLAVLGVKWWNEREIPIASTSAKAQKTTSKVEKKEASQEKQKLAEIERRARELQGLEESPTEPHTLRARDYLPHEEKELRERMGEQVSVVDKLERISWSGSEKTLYLVFRESGPEAPRVMGRYLVRYQSPGMEATDVKKLIGKKIRVTGVLKEEFGSKKRLIIDLITRDQIVEVP